MKKPGRRKAIKLTGKFLLAGFIPNFSFQVKKKSIDLMDVRNEVNGHFNSLLLSGQPYGEYGTGKSTETDLYASCDIAIARHIMGEDLVKTLSSKQRKQWINYINSYQQVEDGSYTKRFNHSRLHANGMTIGALGVLNGRQKYPVKLYERFNTVEKVIPWLEQINWAKQWSASHNFWGGIHCYSLSKTCDQDWLSAVFNWLNANVDPNTGWWRKGIEHTDRHQPLGGSVHILPVYQHHNKDFPYPKKVIDSVLDLQLPNGRWLARKKDQDHVMHYLELDALYALKYLAELAKGYRENEINRSVNKYADLVYEYWNDPSTRWKDQHPHRILSIVGTFGLLQHHLPERFTDEVKWTDIFSDINLYNTAAVEVI